MPYLVGIVLALTISVGATVIGFDRDRAFFLAWLLRRSHATTQPHTPP